MASSGSSRAKRSSRTTVAVGATLTRSRLRGTAEPASGRGRCSRPCAIVRGVIRAAREDDLPVLRDVERAAGAAFHDLGMDAVAEDEPPSLAELAAYQSQGRAWVATDE